MLGLVSILFAQAPYLIVFDSTGSMDSSLPNSSQTKMEAAKIAADNFIDRTNAEIGLVVFEDCDSGGDISSGGIQLVQDFTTDKAALKSSVDALSPTGDTAIANALEESKAYIESSRGRGTIILITDGEETCGGDPVSVASAIYSENIGTVNVIGYQIGGDAEEQAKAIAAAGGGRYYPASDADELSSALTQISGGDLSCCPSAVLLLALPLFVVAINRRLN